jgi:arylsulfatase A-like enzyme
MSRRRRLLARIANAGLALFGLAIVTILGTGGTQITLGPLDIGLHRLANPVLGFALFGVLRVLSSRHDAGLEGRIVRFYARQGLPPRHATCRVGASTGCGAWLGAGLGAVVAVTDGMHFLLTAGHPSPPLGQALLALAAELLTAVGGGLLVGAGLGPAVTALLALRGRQPSRFEVGRWVLCLLLLLAPLLLRTGAPLPVEARSPLVLLLVTATFVASALVVFGVLPAAYLRARRGRWGVTLAVGATLALVGFLVGVGTIGPPAVPGAGGDSGHPNVLLVSIAGLRADALGAYGGPSGTTPRMDDLASRGRAFETAITPSTSSRAAAVSMLTGLYPQRHGVRRRGQRLPHHVATLGDLLAAHGYARGAFVSSRELDGWDSGLAGSFDHYGDVRVFGDYIDRLAVAGLWTRWRGDTRPGWRSAVATTRSLGGWLARQSGPWFAWVSLSEPARPAPVPPEETRDTEQGFEEELWPPPSWAAGMEQARPIEDWLRGYQVSVQTTDRALEVMMRGLAARGELERTLIVLVGLHGTSLGEENVWFEPGQHLSRGVVRVPWISVGPLIVSEEAVPGPVSLVDVAPTLIGLIGLGADEAWQGEDLSRYLIDPESPPRDSQAGPVFSEVPPEPGKAEPPARSVRRGQAKLVRYQDGSERFFVIGDVEQEIIAPRGRSGRQRQSLSDMLTLFLDPAPR